MRDRSLNDASLQALTDDYGGRIFPRSLQQDSSATSCKWLGDFTVEFEEHVTTDLLTTRNDALDCFAACPPNVTIAKVCTVERAEPSRRIEGRPELPVHFRKYAPGRSDPSGRGG